MYAYLFLALIAFFSNTAEAHNRYRPIDRAESIEECRSTQRFVTLAIDEEITMDATLTVDVDGTLYRAHLRVSEGQREISFCTRIPRSRPYFKYTIRLQNTCTTAGDYNLGVVNHEMTLQLQGALCRPSSSWSNPKEDYWNGYDNAIGGLISAVYMQRIGVIHIAAKPERKSKR